MGEGNANEYKQKIIEIVNQIENIKILRLIFGFAKAGVLTRGGSQRIDTAGNQGDCGNS